MLTFEEALAKARERLAQIERDDAAGQLVILDEFVNGRSRGWIFPYNTALWAKTRNPPDGLVGNGPIFVDKNNGGVYVLPSGGWTAWLDEYDRTGAAPPPVSGLKWVGEGPAVPLSQLGIETPDSDEDA